MQRFTRVDPLADEREWLTPYNYVQNNPILRVDPTGALDWIPSTNDKGEIVLTAESGDNVETLMNFFGGEKNASRYLPSWASKVEYTKGSTVKLVKDNVYSKAIKDFAKNFTDSETTAGLSYNCHTACILGALGEDFSNRSFEEGNYDAFVRDELLMEHFTPIVPGEEKFGETIITFANDHSAVFFGRNKKGEGYVFEKPNFSQPPRISKTKDVSNSRGGIMPSKAFGGNDYGLYNKRKE